jgi:hypothetical protein
VFIRAWFTFSMVALAAGSVLTACLPDLRVFPAETSGARCGDGFVEIVSSSLDEACDPGQSGAPGCSSTCRIVCEGAVTTATRHCYFVAGAVASYAEASEACRAASAHLVTFSGDDEVQSVRELSLSSRYWVGLLKDGTGVYATDAREEPGFPVVPARGPCSGCYARAAADSTFPDYPGTTGDLGCLVASQGLGSAWLRVPCTIASSLPTGTTGTPLAPFDALCEREPPGARAEACTGGVCIHLPFTEKRYLLVSAPASSADAVATCQGLGGSLVVFDSHEEREELAREIARFSPELGSFFIGLSRAPQATAFVWEDGRADDESVRPRVWAEREPVAKGAARAFVDLRKSYDTRLARASDDDRPRAFVCQYR